MLREPGMGGSLIKRSLSSHDTDVLCCSINHPGDKGLWEEMTAIKQDILRKWDSFPYSVQVCCVKFVQRVVQVQSHGLISDPRVCTGLSAMQRAMLTHFSVPNKTRPPWPSSLKTTPFYLCRTWKLKLLAFLTGSWPSSRKIQGMCPVNVKLLH